MSFDDVFGIHARALVLRAERAQILADNLANADTPGYKARDINFKQALSQATGDAGKLAVTGPGQIASGDSSLLGADLMYRNPLQPSVDGNTVNTEVEQSEFAKNAMKYEVSLQFINGRIKSLMTAIKGE